MKFFGDMYTDSDKSGTTLNDVVNYLRELPNWKLLDIAKDIDTFANGRLYDLADDIIRREPRKPGTYIVSPRGPNKGIYWEVKEYLKDYIHSRWDISNPWLEKDVEKYHPDTLVFNFNDERYEQEFIENFHSFIEPNH